MNDILLYFLKSGISMGLFYMIYRLFMQKETLHTVNRLYLMGTMVLALVLPLLPFENLFVVKERLSIPTFMISPDNTEINAASATVSAGETNIPAYIILKVFYLCGVAILAGMLVLEFTRLIFLKKLRKERFGPMRVLIVKKEIVPFSWFNLIFIGHFTRLDPQVVTILQHECEHYRKLHFLDLLVLEMITIFQWFNPFIWLYVRAIREIHEYQADAAVLTGGKDAGSYKALLVNQITGAEVFRLANAFSKSLTKKRMVMMTRIKSKRSAWFKALIAVPALAILLMAFSNRPRVPFSFEPFSCSGLVMDKETGDALQGAHVIIQGTTTGTVTNRDGRFSLQVIGADANLAVSYVGFRTVIIPPGKKELKIGMEPRKIRLEPYNTGNTKPEDAGNEVNEDNEEKAEKADLKPEQEIREEDFSYVEELAHFPGGIEALGQYLTENIRYPDHAEPGKPVVITVGFTVAADGSIWNVHLDDETSGNMDREAIRVVEEMPDWTPASQHGKPVRTDYILPVQFKKQF